MTGRAEVGKVGLGVVTLEYRMIDRWVHGVDGIGGKVKGRKGKMGDERGLRSSGLPVAPDGEIRRYGSARLKSLNSWGR